MYDEQARADIAALTKRMDTLEKSLEKSLMDTLQENLNRVRKNVNQGTMQMKKDVDTFITSARKATFTYITKYTDDRFAELDAKLKKLEETVGVASSLTNLAPSTSYKI